MLQSNIVIYWRTYAEGTDNSNICLSSFTEADVTKVKIWKKNYELCKVQLRVGLFMWLLLACQIAVSILNDVCSQCLKLRMKPEFSALSACCTGHQSAEKTHSLFSSPPHPSPSCPTEKHEAIFEDTQASRMAAVWLIIAWRKMVNKGHGMAHADWAAMVKSVWRSSLNLLRWCCVNIAFIHP